MDSPYDFFFSHISDTHGQDDDESLLLGDFLSSGLRDASTDFNQAFEPSPLIKSLLPAFVEQSQEGPNPSLCDELGERVSQFEYGAIGCNSQANQKQVYAMPCEANNFFPQPADPAVPSPEHANLFDDDGSFLDMLVPSLQSRKRPASSLENGFSCIAPIPSEPTPYSEGEESEGVEEDGECFEKPLGQPAQLNTVIVSTPGSRPVPSRPSQTIKNHPIMKTSHTVRQLEPMGEAHYCNLEATDTQDTCGQLYFMKVAGTGDWSHTLCRKTIDTSGKEVYKACAHYSFCMLCDPNTINHQAKKFWNRSKYYNHRSKKHSHEVFANNWEVDHSQKDGGLCARFNEVAREKGFYHTGEDGTLQEGRLRVRYVRPRI